MVTNDQYEKSTRRRVLTAAGAAVVGTSLLGSNPVLAADDVQSGFATVVDVVEAGADPTGEKPVDPIVEKHARDDTLLYFPAGRYKLAQFRNYTGAYGTYDPNFYSPLRNFGLLGEGSDAVTLVPREGTGSDAFGPDAFERLWFELRGGRDLLFQGFTLDYTAQRTGGRVQLYPDDGLLVRDVRVDGVIDVPQSAFSFHVGTKGGRGLVENVRVPDGAVGRQPVGMFIPKSHRGALTIRNCTVQEFPNNGLYASAPAKPGVVRVIGGYYANNNIAQVRLGSAGSVAKNVRVVVERAPAKWADDATINMRGIRVSRGGPVAIENCVVRMGGGVQSSGGIVGTRYGSAFSVKNTRVHVDDLTFHNHAIYGKATRVPGFDGSVELKNVRITGDASGGAAIRLVERSNNVFENVCIDQPGWDRDGIELVRSDVSIRNSVIGVTGAPILADEESDYSTERVRYANGCSAPTVGKN